MSLHSKMTFRLAPSKRKDQITSATLAQTQPVQPSSDHQEVRLRPDSAAVVAETELRRRAYQNAPRCTGQNAHIVQEWMTISQAADTFRMSKRVLSAWASQNLIFSIKGGDSVNSHRIVHIDNILALMEDQLQIARETVASCNDINDDDNDTPNDQEKLPVTDNAQHDLMQVATMSVHQNVLAPSETRPRTKAIDLEQ